MPHNDTHDPFIVTRLLELYEQTATLPSSGLESRVTAHLSGLSALVGARRGFLVVAAKKPRSAGEDLRVFRATSLTWFEAPPGAYARGDEVKEKIKATLDDPAMLAMLRHVGHRCLLLGALGHERRVVAVHSLGQQTELFLGFDRDPFDPTFTEQDRGALLLTARHLGSFYRRVARELGALDAERLLSPRERDVLALLLTGLSEKEIASRLGMTDRSTHQRITALYRNYDVRSRPELMALVLGG